jgi:hypothetical protein
LWFIQKGNIGLRNLGVDILQSDVHRAHSNSQVLEAGEEVEEVMGGQGQFGGFAILRGKFEEGGG